MPSWVAGIHHHHHITGSNVAFLFNPFVSSVQGRQIFLHQSSPTFGYEILCKLPSISGVEREVIDDLSQKNWVGMCGPLPKFLTLFMTKICDIPYPTYDLTKNSKPYLCSEPYIKILFQTCVTIESLVQTNVKLP